MNLFDYRPVVSVPRPEIEKKIKELEWAIQALQKELDKRGPNEVEKWGFTSITGRGKGFIQTGYVYYDTFNEAVEAYRIENPHVDKETSYYRVHKVYVGR